MTSAPAAQRSVLRVLFLEPAEVAEDDECLGADAQRERHAEAPMLVVVELGGDWLERLVDPVQSVGARRRPDAHERRRATH